APWRPTSARARCPLFVSRSPVILLPVITRRCELETFADVVRSRAGDPAPGLLFEGQTWTWSEVVQESADRAAALTATVPRPADRQIHVGVLMENVPDFVFWVGATSLAGAVVVGINSSRSSAEIAHDLRHVGIDMVITEDRLA